MEYSSQQNGGRRLLYDNNIKLKLKIDLYENLYGKEFIKTLKKYYDSNEEKNENDKDVKDKGEEVEND
jgi:hypothetical protein